MGVAPNETTSGTQHVQGGQTEVAMCVTKDSLVESSMNCGVKLITAII